MNETQKHRIEYHSAFQKILIHFATTFINLPIDQMDDTITDALRQLSNSSARCVLRSTSSVQTSPAIISFTISSSRHCGNTLLTDGLVPNDDIIQFSLAHHQAIAIANVDELPESSELGGNFFKVPRIVAIADFCRCSTVDGDHNFGSSRQAGCATHPLDQPIVDLAARHRRGFPQRDESQARRAGDPRLQYTLETRVANAPPNWCKSIISFRRKSSAANRSKRPFDKARASSTPYLIRCRFR